ncbi:MAG: Crp/Fnr family transcriptional regulator [Terriglobales bacterium]|jgi:CRP-like cAMP-binding protein
MTSSPIIVSVANRLVSPFLEGLTQSDRATVFAAASERRVQSDSVVVTQGDQADYLFLIVKGCARYFYITPDGKKIVLFWLMPGQIFGGSALLPAPTEYLVGTEILKDGCLLVWHRDRIRALASQIPRLLDNALSVANDYLTWYVAAHTSLVTHSAEQRLAQVLVTLAHGLGHQVSGGTRIELTNEQLANAANVTTFTASRILSTWQRNGILVKTRGQLLLRSPEQLFPAHP